MVILPLAPFLVRGAVSPRSSQYMQPRTLTNISILAALSLRFVSKATGLHSPLTLRRAALPMQTACGIHRVWVSKTCPNPASSRDRLPRWSQSSCVTARSGPGRQAVKANGTRLSLPKSNGLGVLPKILNLVNSKVRMNELNSKMHNPRTASSIADIPAILEESDNLEK